MDRFDALPADVFALLLRFFSGFELFPLSHVNRRFYRDLLASQRAAWASRLSSRSFPRSPVPQRTWKAAYKRVIAAAKDLVRSRSHDRMANDETRYTWKRVYFSSRTIRFPGCSGVHVERYSGGVVSLWSRHHDRWVAGAFSFDVWFALLPSSKPKNFGGIVFGAQSTEWPDVEFNRDYHQYLHIDTNGNLYCSVAAKKTVVASALKANRWYHVAVSMERRADDWPYAKQTVYLDGEQIEDAAGYFLPRGLRLDHAQLGSGVIDGRSPGSPSPSHRGWYGFNGVLDEFRFWDGVLTPAQVTKLFQGRNDVVEADGVAVVWSMKRDGDIASYRGNVELVRSTRPREQQYIPVSNV